MNEKVFYQRSIFTVKKISILLFMLAALFAVACKNSSNDKKTSLYRERKILLGTVVNLTIDGVGAGMAKEAASRVFSLISRMDGVFSRGGDKELTAIEKNAGSQKYTSVSPELYAVIASGVFFGNLSGGKFDISIYPVTRLWGFSEEGGARLPEAKEIKEVLPLVGYKEIRLKKPSMVLLERRGMMLDLGGMAKGYIIDKAAQLLKEMKIPAFVIDIGGDIVVSGLKRGSEMWNVGVQDPREKDKLAAVLKITDAFIATSGDYERFFIKDGKRYHHIIDPGTGYPAKSGIMSATVIAGSALDADCYSTAAFLLGASAGLDLLEKTEGVEGVLITSDNRVFKTKNMGKYEIIN